MRIEIKYLLLFFLIACRMSAQDLTVVHNAATENIAGVLFDSKSKSIRDNVKAFENRNGIKLQFRVDDESIDHVGGLSEHLFRLFQDFTYQQNAGAKNITGEFSAMKNSQLNEFLSYQTKATPDLAGCLLPPADSKKVDELYSKGLGSGFTGSVAAIAEMPESLDGLYIQAATDYEKILNKNRECPGTFNAALYNVHVLNTRSSRSSKWTADGNALSLSISTNYGLLSSGGQNSNQSLPPGLNIDPGLFNGSYMLNLNGSVNSCTQEDMEVRSRMLFAKTGIRYLFITQNIDYFLPQDSLQLFLNAAARTFSSNTTDDIIIALYLKMHDAVANVTLGNLLVKQINGSWLTAGDINYAQYNSGGTYANGVYYKYKSLFRNIPKPLIVCYQVAKVNGLLTTTYFNKSQHTKGSEQIYYHVFKIDKAFREISETYSRLYGIYSSNNTGGNSNLGISGNISSADRKLVDELMNEIKVKYLTALLFPRFEDSEVHFKEIYLQNKAVAQNAALRNVESRYGQLYSNNNFSALTSNLTLPGDMEVGTCKTTDRSDAVADVLNISSLLLMPTGFDFIPDALSVAYFAATDKTTDMILASASLITPGSVTAFKKVIRGSADIVKEANKGARLEKTASGIAAIQPHVNLISGAFKTEASQMSGQLIAKINANPQVVENLLTFTKANSTLMSHVSEKLTTAKKIEFLNKVIDEPAFLQKVKADPDEVLKWAGKFTNKQIEDYVTFATQNKYAQQVMLGKYGDGGPSSYIQRAGNEYTYFDMGSEKWNEAERLVNGNSLEMWEINKEFLYQQKVAGKQFYFSHEPWKSQTHEFLSKEAEYLIEIGAKNFEKINENTWEVIW
jgi:hypothetical protein